MKSTRQSAVLIVMAAAFTQAGCGGEEPAQAKIVAPTERMIYVSAVDCEAGEKFTLEECSTAIDKAIQSHEKKATTFKSLTSCEDAEGPDKCERIGDQVFRPRLVAYIFEKKEQPSARPLYLIKDGTHGFRNAENETLLGKDDNLIFSKSARDLYELNSKKRPGA